MRQHDLYDYRGKPVLLEFMKTACPACQTLSVELENVRSKYSDKIAVIAVVNPPDNFNTVGFYINEHKITAPILFDMGQVAISYFKATPDNPRIHLPHLFLIDSDGTIKNDWGDNEAVDAAKDGTLAASIDALIERRAPAKK